ncbi:hypothetical protein PRUPE_4G090700 [Prunus persica]|uniref:WPP domain-associated protein n=1 Tax=Prunus persica TaxID=3760 RepID=A0A251PHW9_PRUPE|nr:WPP domain-associated protein [Prunus persica]XP_020417401.1 WPP domain-associated protein [Prunus persica]XP_020417402.1 WPP domain-associated protein [Prunus persica]ONI11160.1 hypothetical protein PRUPE_4G090700 [Prunus persica]ONI11161.1 hypothetical protein PRUPE_4G090700 [Prunus persica]ONI11162.1 hypothetical protein PRUPE_4G090700 [Prunus persica]ONI11163.1 hypothetical protein PRUPE_4G090700 [Prunus persica]
MESLEVMSNGVQSCNGGLMQFSNDVKENDNRDVDLLEDFDSYWQDINDRLTISRMVSDSVIKGMVNAVTQEAAEKIADKELQVTKLKEMLRVYHVGVDENELLGSLAVHQESNRFVKEGNKDKIHPSFLEAVLEHDRIEESLSSLRGATKEQFKKLKREIDSIRGRSSVKRIGSSSQLSGLSDILQDKVSDRWIDVDRTLNCLKSTIETSYQQVEQMVRLSKASVCEWQQEQEFKAEIEALVMTNCIWSLEENFLDRFYGDKNVNGHGRMKEISSLRQELDTISKSLSVSDIGQLSSHGSLEVDEESSNFKKGDHPHRKLLNNLNSSSPSPSPSSSSLSTSTSSSSYLWEENGKHDENGKDDESEINMQESLDPTRVMHMSRDELINYYNNEMTKLKRNHESKVQDMIEHRFSRMRELLKERGSSLSSKKNKEFDMLRRRISEVIFKLDDILVENEQIATFGINEESLSGLKDRLESLLSENHQLRDLLTDKKREVKFLSQQVSEAAEKMSEHSLAEAKLLKTTANLKAAIEDAHIEALIREDAFSFILRGIMDQIKCMAEESQVEYNLLQEIYKSTFKEAAHNGEPTSQCEIEDLNVESIITQELYVVVFRETVNDAEQKLNNLNMKYTNENQLRVLLEMENLDKRKKLEVEVANKEKLKQEVIFLAEEKEQLAQDAAAALEKEKERYELAAQELENLRGETFQQQKLISESIEESNAARRNLVLALEQIEIHKAEICKLDQKLELAMKELGKLYEERRMLLDVNQEKHNAVSLFEAKERELKEQLKSIAVYSHGLLKAVTDFECRVTQDISGKCSRLKRLSSQSHSLKEKANVLVRRGSLYKQRFERKCSDLEKAEAEVDLLGDEVETLLSLVEKIYIALDHYSPILQHYPGITEVLKLVRRELRGETKTV